LRGIEDLARAGLDRFAMLLGRDHRQRDRHVAVGRRQVGHGHVQQGRFGAERLGEPHALLDALVGERRAVGRQQQMMEHWKLLYVYFGPKRAAASARPVGRAPFRRAAC
jgi:hypothetical protein